MIKVTIEYTEKSPRETQIFIFERMSAFMEIGIDIFTPPAGEMKIMQSNNQRRCLIQLWSGCEKFEDFIAQTVINNERETCPRLNDIRQADKGE